MRRRGRTGSRRDWAGTAPPGAGAACSRGCWTSGASASSSTLGSRTALAWSCAPRMRAADDPSARARRRADAVRARRRRGFERVRPRLPRRFADRGGDPPSPLAPPEAAPVAVGGARLGRHRAADRGAPRGTDPALDREAMGRKAPAARTRRTAAEDRHLARAWRSGTCRPPRWSPASRPPSSPPTTSRRRARSPSSTALARSPPDASTPPTRPGTGGCSGSRHRAVDPAGARARRPRRARLACGRPRLRQARRRAQPPRAPGDGRRGRGVLRPLRAVPGPRRQLRPRPLARGGRAGAAARVWA